MPIEEQGRIARKEYVFAPKPNPMGRPSHRHESDHEGHEPEGKRPGIRSIAGLGNPRDVGDMAAELIVKSQNPKIALGSFIDRLIEARLVPRSTKQAMEI